MSFDLSAAGGWGSGALGDVTDPTGVPTGVINSYYLVESFSGSTFVVANPATAINGMYKNLKNADDLVGEEFLIHAFAATNGPTSNPQLGKWRVVKIISVDYETTPAVFTTDKDLSDLNSNAYFWQAVWIPHFASLTLTSGDIKPYNPNVKINLRTPGGVLALKCFGTLTLNGGHINLADCGLPTDTAETFRPLSTQEGHLKDTQLYAGCENSITKDKLLLNCGDGACFIVAKKIVTQASSRIGNTDIPGVQYCRGSADSKATHSGTIVGGSSILIACSTWPDFKPANIAKYRNPASEAGRGLARAYIATYNLLSAIRPDEGLYALDAVKNKTRLSNALNIRSFGNGSAGSYTETSATQYNSYAKITSVSSDFKTFGVSVVSTGAFDFANSKLVMIHQLQKSSGADVNSGFFTLARITSYNGSSITVDTPFEIDLNKYYGQIILIPEFVNLTPAATNNKTLAWSDGVGGIFAVAVSGTLNLSSKKINLQGKGTHKNISNALVGNNFMRSRLFIGQGHGTAFILANNITMNSSTRIGADYSGASFGGKAVIKSSGAFGGEGGYAGYDGTTVDPDNTGNQSLGTGGWGGGGGANVDGNNGGWFGNAPKFDYYTVDKYSAPYGCQGAHMLIIADTISGFCLDAISTGGSPGSTYTGVSGYTPDGTAGGAGYGGGGAYNGREVLGRWNFGGAGGYRGGGAGTGNQSPAYQSQGVEFGGGGAAGAAFVYCNNVVNQSTTGIVTY